MTDDVQASDTRALEALLFVSDEPLASTVLAQALGLDRRSVDAMCEDSQTTSSDAILGWSCVR